MPAIAAEGRALHEAAAAQGIAGVMARQRTSPYLPGVHSRAVAVHRRPAPAWREGAGDAAASRRALEDDSGPPTGAAPVLALIRRLPLDEDAAE